MKNPLKLLILEKANLLSTGADMQHSNEHQGICANRTLPQKKSIYYLVQMKPFLIIVIALLFYVSTHCQSLAGSWKGGYYMGDYLFQTVPFALDISLNKDGSYRIYSTTIFEQDRDTLVSEAKYRLAAADSIYMEELQIKKQKKDRGCPQKFSLALKTRDGKMILEGIWGTPEHVVNYCGRDAGRVLLTKQE